MTIHIYEMQGVMFMELIYPFLIAFSMVFVSELGDKTQLLVLSFSSKGQTFKILLGVALGSFFSHGLAILFGSSIHLFASNSFHTVIHWLTYLSFLLIGLISLLPPKDVDGKKDGLIYKISHLKLNYCLIIALCIIVGELGDKTFLASMGLGIQYPHCKIALIAGAICAMVACDFIAILFGKFLNKHISEKSMQKLSGILFLLFGMIGIVGTIMGE